MSHCVFLEGDSGERKDSISESVKAALVVVWSKLFLDRASALKAQRGTLSTF